MATPSQELASLILGEPIDDWVARRRDDGIAWRDIAAELATATDGKVAVTGEAVRLWYRPEAEDPAA